MQIQTTQAKLISQQRIFDHWMIITTVDSHKHPHPLSSAATSPPPQTFPTFRGNLWRARAGMRKVAPNRKKEKRGGDGEGSSIESQALIWRANALRASEMPLCRLRGCVWSQAAGRADSKWCTSLPALLLAPLRRARPSPTGWKSDLAAGLSGSAVKTNQTH